MNDHHDKKNMKRSEKIGKRDFISLSRVSLDSPVDDYPTHDHHIHKHRHCHHSNGRKKESADRKNQRKLLSQYQSIKSSSPNHRDGIAESTQEITKEITQETTQEITPEITPEITREITQETNESDYELETTLNSEAVDVKYKLIQEYSSILKTIHEQNKYLEKMRSRILSIWKRSERQGLEALFCDEQTKLNEDLEKALILRSNYASGRWPEFPDTSQGSSGCPCKENVDSVRRSAGQEKMANKSGAYNTGNWSDLFSDSFGTDANEDSDLQWSNACCCSWQPASHSLAGGGFQAHSNGTCYCPTSPVFIQNPNSCCCRQMFEYTKFSY